MGGKKKNKKLHKKILCFRTNNVKKFLKVKSRMETGYFLHRHVAAGQTLWNHLSRRPPSLFMVET